MDNKEISSGSGFFITILFGFAGSLLIGLLFRGYSIFEFETPGSFVLVMGITGAIVYSALKFKTLKDSVLLCLTLLLLNLIIMGSAPISYYVRDVVLFTGFWFCIFFYKLWLKRLSDKYMFLRALGFAAITAFIFIAASFVLILINVPFIKISSEMISKMILFYLQAGTIVGLGLGLGFDSAEIYLGVKSKRPKEHIRLQ
jgi:uncharacterized membrane protein YeaQ/YmgE (transglycosylase-associated protein family)